MILAQPLLERSLPAYFDDDGGHASHPARSVWNWQVRVDPPTRLAFSLQLPEPLGRRKTYSGLEYTAEVNFDPVGRCSEYLVHASAKVIGSGNAIHFPQGAVHHLEAQAIITDGKPDCAGV